MATPHPTQNADVAIIGAGVIGLTTAYFAAKRGLRVLLIDKQLPGQEASWAGAGMLPPGNDFPELPPEARLRGASHALWEPLSQELRELTGIENGYSRGGGLELAGAGEGDRVAGEITRWRKEGVRGEPLDQVGLRRFCPDLGPTFTHGYFLPDYGQVRNPWHLRALLTACEKLGVTLCTNCEVLGFERKHEQCRSLVTATGKIEAQQFVVTCGAWSAKLLTEARVHLPIRPIRGQIVLLKCPEAPFSQVLNIGHRYLVPRNDGRVLIGATEEDVGFEKGNTPAGVGGLLDLAQQVLPSLANVTIERTWSGLRPHAPGGLPLIGSVPGWGNLYIAAGHFRAGLQLSPITGKLISQLLAGEQPDLDLTPFSPHCQAQGGSR